MFKLLETTTTTTTKFAVIWRKTVKANIKIVKK